MLFLQYFCILIVTAMQAFIDNEDHYAYWANLANPLIGTQATIFHTQSIIGDIFLVSLLSLRKNLRGNPVTIKVYRCYVTWGKRKSIVALPILTTVGTASKKLPLPA